MKSEKPVRVQKAIADRGHASRREAESWIGENRVTVNGEIVSLGDRCLPFQDEICLDGRKLPNRQPRKVVLAMNKPRGYLCTNRDPHGGKTVFDLLPPEFKSIKLSVAGRLDKDSEGLLLLTNDGDLHNKLAHPTYKVRKLYNVQIDKPLREADIPKMIRGIKWEGETLSLDKVFPIKGRGKEDSRYLEVTLFHGKKREIRRLFYAFGYDVKRLRRVQIGQFRLRGIERGNFQILRHTDIELLLNSSFAR